MFVSLFAMLVSCIRMVLGVLMLATGVMMFGLMMMMRRRVVMSGSSVMMLLRGMLWRLCHLGFLRWVDGIYLNYHIGCSFRSAATD